MMKSKLIALVKASHFMFVSLPEFISQGSISIDTSFQYKPVSSNENRNFLFRTTIQPDADIINFLPNPDLFPDDNNWHKLYGEKYQEHKVKLQKFLVSIDSIKSIVWAISACFGFGSVIYPIYLAQTRLILSAYWLIVIFFTTLPLLTYVFRTILLRYLLRLFIQISIRVIKRADARIDKGQVS
ncbi:hypothetical protein FJZ31_14485 [Candidatus Poribacteria bacterium]|nr:hypothetical protein [Candidatus Poribacteria bacterium]